jgi:hypothetical protein
MLWIGNRYRTKKERLPLEKDVPPLCADGSLYHTRSFIPSSPIISDEIVGRDQ